MAGSRIVILNEQSFEHEVLHAPIPVLVDFWAEWCGPCKMIAPLFDEIAEDYQGRIRVGKINIDEQPHLAEQYGIRAVPTLLIFKGGGVVEQLVGGQIRKRELKATLDRYLPD